MTRRRTRVLLVDDREQIRSMLRDVLTGFDCVFTEAEDGERALELIETTAFDVIVLDYKLSGLSGIDVLIEARKRELALGKIIVLTGYADVHIATKAHQLGVFQFLPKASMTRDGIRSAFQNAVGIAPAMPVPSARLRRTRQRSSATNRPRPSLLLVDSDPSSMNKMLQILSEDFSPIPAKDADDAFRTLARRTPDLVVLDVNLAGHVSGLDLLRRMRKSVPNLRAIMISDKLDPDAVFESAQRGALKYVLKSELATLPTVITRILNDRRHAARVFLCYARADVVFISRVYNRLMKKGFFPWMDEKSLRVGSEWALEIEKAIKESDFFIFFTSRNSVGRQGPMRREVKVALRVQDEKISPFFIPARLEDCPLDPSLEHLQHVDLFKRNGFTKLVGTLSG